MTPKARLNVLTCAGIAAGVVVVGTLAEWVYSRDPARVAAAAALAGLLWWGALAAAEYHRTFERRGDLLRKHRISED